MRCVSFALVGCALLGAACSSDESGIGRTLPDDGGKGDGRVGSSGGASGTGGSTATGGAPGTECKTMGDCPQTNCFGCPGTVCVNGRCVAGPVSTGGATGTGGVVGAGGATSSCSAPVLVYASEPRCQAWLQSNCCADLQACEADTACRTAVTCINACPSPRTDTCLNNCAPSSATLLDNIGECSKAAPSPSGSQCAWP